jgi:16S rRNA processing protein RimM
LQKILLQNRLQRIIPRSKIAVIRINDPMAYTSYILLGRITKINGYEGAVTVKLENSYTENIPHLESVFLEVDGRPVPFFLSGYEYSSADILKLSFDGYRSIEKINEFKGCRVFLTSGMGTGPMPDKRTNLSGYSVLLQDGNILGIITDVIQNPGQWLLNILSPSDKNILIPFHDDFLVSIDNNRKNIVMHLPDGLIDIN